MSFFSTDKPVDEAVLTPAATPGPSWWLAGTAILLTVATATGLLYQVYRAV